MNELVRNVFSFMQSLSAFFFALDLSEIMSIHIDPLRELLIASIHSDSEAQESLNSRLNDPEMLLKLCVVCAPHDSYSNACRMEAASYISRYSPQMIAEVIPLLAVILTVPDCEGEDMNRNIAIHLIRAIRKGLPEYTGKFYHDLDALSQKYGCED